MSARRLNSGELPVNVDVESTIATLFSVITPAPVKFIQSHSHTTIMKVDIFTW